MGVAVGLGRVGVAVGVAVAVGVQVGVGVFGLGVGVSVGGTGVQVGVLVKVGVGSGVGVLVGVGVAACACCCCCAQPVRDRLSRANVPRVRTTQCLRSNLGVGGGQLDLIKSHSSWSRSTGAYFKSGDSCSERIRCSCRGASSFNVSALGSYLF